MDKVSYYAIIGYAVFFLLEVYISWRDKRHLYHRPDTLSNMAMGIGSLVVAFLGKALSFGVYSFFYQFRMVEPDTYTWYYWTLLFFGEDLSKYWFHRICHYVRYFWASHVVHHSSQKMNFSVAFRQSWTYEISGAMIFWCWLPVLGFQPLHILYMQSFNLIYQFWIHTETIKKLPAPIEFVFNTPSHHRVHHSSEPRYINKNFGGVLIIWDRLFGSFKAEEKQSVGHHHFGITENIRTYNPLKIAFLEWWNLFKTAVASRNWKELGRSLVFFPRSGNKENNESPSV